MELSLLRESIMRYLTNLGPDKRLCTLLLKTIDFLDDPDQERINREIRILSDSINEMMIMSVTNKSETKNRQKLIDDKLIKLTGYCFK